VTTIVRPRLGDVWLEELGGWKIVDWHVFFTADPATGKADLSAVSFDLFSLDG
jgi:hypothetical protein